jgi:hypothetical protein
MATLEESAPELMAELYAMLNGALETVRDAIAGFFKRALDVCERGAKVLARGTVMLLPFLLGALAAKLGKHRGGGGGGGKPDLTDAKGKKHILDGDKSGGGHRPGTGNPGKSEFPQGWSDERILGEISDVATDPSATRRPLPGGREIAEGTRDGRATFLL